MNCIRSLIIAISLISILPTSIVRAGCFSNLAKAYKSKRIADKSKAVVEFNNDTSAYINEVEELMSSIKEWAQIGSRGQTIHTMKETGAKLRLVQLMEMSSTSEVVGQLQAYIKIPDMAYFTALKHKRHLDAFKNLKKLTGVDTAFEDFKNFGNLITTLKHEIEIKEIFNDKAFKEILGLLSGVKSKDESTLAIQKLFPKLKKSQIEDAIDNFISALDTSPFLKDNCAKGTTCFQFVSQTPKLFSYDFSKLLKAKNQKSLVKMIENELKEIEYKAIQQAAKLYRNKAEYIAIRKRLRLYLPAELSDEPQKLFKLGKSASARMDRIDELRRLLRMSDDANELDEFKRELNRFKTEFPDAPEAKRINLDFDNISDFNLLVEEFDRIYFAIKASVVWFNFEPMFSLQKFGKEIGVKVQLLRVGQIFEINDHFPASKIQVLRESLHTEIVSAIVTMIPDESVYRILNKVSDLVTWFPGLRDSKVEIKQFFQSLVDEKAILKSYPKIDELTYGPGTLKQRYKSFKEYSATNSLGDVFVNTFGRRADEKAQKTFDQFFILLEKEIEGIKSAASDVPNYKDFSSNHPLVKIFEQMQVARNELKTKGNLAPWFENPPNSARYFRLLITGVLTIGTAYGGYELVNWIGQYVDPEVLKTINDKTMKIVKEEAANLGISIDSIGNKNASSTADSTSGNE